MGIPSREILVSERRDYLADVRASVPVTPIAKFKPTVQRIAIDAMILDAVAVRDLPERPALTYSTLAYAALWIAAALTVYTGWIYFRAGLVHVSPDRDTSGGAGETA